MYHHDRIEITFFDYNSCQPCCLRMWCRREIQISHYLCHSSLLKKACRAQVEPISKYVGLLWTPITIRELKGYCAMHTLWPSESYQVYLSKSIVRGQACSPVRFMSPCLRTSSALESCFFTYHHSTMDVSTTHVWFEPYVIRHPLTCRHRKYVISSHLSHHLPVVTVSLL